jgi:8-oxo-(d)GTP phosphatase
LGHDFRVEKTLILIRHAHRSKRWGSEADNGLSARGRKQAERLRRFFLGKFPKGRVRVVSSPKARCVETVEPIARSARTRVRAEPLLDEGAALAARCARFESWWRRRAPARVVACSHGDLLPVLLLRLTGARADMSKGAWAEVRLKGGRAELVSLVQEPGSP